jgi:hypothetical protein
LIELGQELDTRARGCGKGKDSIDRHKDAAGATIGAANF